MENTHEYNLRSALCFVGEDEMIPELARILLYACTEDSVSYKKIKGIIKDNPEEILLLADEWRLLLPVRTNKSSGWEDRLLLFKDDEFYEMPNIIRYLVTYSLDTGKWDVKNAMFNFFKDLKDPDFNLIPDLTKAIMEKSLHNIVNANQIKKACMEFFLINRVDGLIAELKAAGFMSPKLGSLIEASIIGTPIYELNPSLLPGK